MSTEDLQNQIRAIIAELNWKLPKLAEVLFTALNDDEVFDENTEIKKFYEKLKGHLKREKTPPELLRNYLNIITCHPAYIKNDVITPKYIPSDKISESLRCEMGTISKSITQMIIDEDQQPKI